MSVICGHGHSGNAHLLSTSVYLQHEGDCYMRNIEIRPDGATVGLTLHELVILKNAMNETLDALGDDSISIRVGTTMGEFLTLFREVQQTIQACRRPVVAD